MKAQRYSLSALLCVGLAVGVTDLNAAAAQSNTATPNVRVTVIGCIRRSPPAMGDTVGTTVIPAGETRYLLSNITLVPPDGQTPTADAGSGSTANLVAAAVTVYRLDDSAASQIAPHVGDRVQVTGSIVPTPRSSTGTAGRTQLSPTEASPLLRVQSVQQISSDSATCSQ